LKAGLGTHSAIALCVSFWRLGGSARFSQSLHRVGVFQEMNMRLRLLLTVVAGTTAVFSTPVQAQTKIDFNPHIGMYFPLEPVVLETTQQLTKRQVTAVVLGGRFSVHPNKRWAFEATFDYSPSQVAITEDQRTFDVNGGLLVGSLRSVVKFGPWKPKTPELQVTAGIGVINRFGSAWRGHTGTTDPAGVIGIAGRYPMGAWMPLNVRFEIENYISHVQFGPAEGGLTNRRLNHDTFWSFGFELPLNGPDHP
jgi:hypothetical protein